MQKLAKDASDRIFNYLLDIEQKKDITSTEITKGVLHGKSKRNKLGVREGRTVIDKNTEWKTSKFYTKTGIVIEKEGTFYKNEHTHTKKYGHRRPLPWESVDQIKENWEEETGFKLRKYLFTGDEHLYKIMRDYIMTKSAYEEAKLERENYHRDSNEDRKLKHEETLLTFREYFKELLEDLGRQYKIVSTSHTESKELLMDVADKQDEDKFCKLKLRRNWMKFTPT
ncbi:hypothetical protein NQ318_023115 [Aromia moschata]|uniref:Uncharacterized protein n=1 Tax=Aromia moschata TaxID=1265417 RepID=A0AAV8XT39_9CUCU|nr:hypothetical protein NQ318_023115 [Aromia moschata]